MSIPPPPTFAPPSLPDERSTLTTYTRTRSVSPAPFIISHDTFIKAGQSKIATDKQVTLSSKGIDVEEKQKSKDGTTAEIKGTNKNIENQGNISKNTQVDISKKSKLLICNKSKYDNNHSKDGLKGN